MSRIKNKIIRKLLNLYLAYLSLSPYIISSIPLIMYRFFPSDVIFLLIVSIPIGFSFHKDNSFDGKNYRKVRKFKRRYKIPEMVQPCSPPKTKFYEYYKSYGTPEKKKKKRQMIDVFHY